MQVMLLDSVNQKGIRMQAVNRQGIGKREHVEKPMLWLQRRCRLKDVLKKFIWSKFYSFSVMD